MNIIVKARSQGVEIIDKTDRSSVFVLYKEIHNLMDELEAANEAHYKKAGFTPAHVPDSAR